MTGTASAITTTLGGTTKEIRCISQLKGQVTKILFNSGNPALLDMTRQYAGDPTGAARPLWADQVVKDFINTTYSELLDLARIMGMGWEHEITHDTAVDGTQFYNAPADNRRILDVMISSTGKDLSTTSPASADVVVLTFAHETILEPEYRANRITTLRYWTMRGVQYGIFAPPDSAAAGTNSIRLLYEGESALLSGDTDEPVFPRDTHNTICLRAGMLLRATRNLPLDDLREETRIADARFRSSIRTIVSQKDEQMTAAGLPVDMGLHKSGTTG